MRPVLLALALLLLAPPVAAQGLPGLPVQCGPGQVNLIPANAEIAPGGTRVLTGAVGNQNDQRAVPSALIAVNAPAGWTAVANPESLENIPAGGSATFELTVTAPANATTAGLIDVSVTFACSGVPVDQWQSQPVTATVTPVGPGGGAGGALVDFGERYGLLLLGVLAIVAVGGAALVGATRARAGLVADAPEPLKQVKPGRGTSFPIRVENKDRQPDTVRFEVGDVPTGWAAFTALPEVTLSPGESRTMWLMVRAPAEAPEGAQAAIPLTIRSDAKPGRSRSLAVRAEVREAAEPSASPGESSISQ